MERDIREIRAEIDALNIQLADFFRRRMELSEEMAAYKQAHRLPICDPAREAEILSSMTALVGEEYAAYGEAFFRQLMELSKARQRELTEAESEGGNP